MAESLKSRRFTLHCVGGQVLIYLQTLCNIPEDLNLRQTSLPEPQVTHY